MAYLHAVRCRAAALPDATGGGIKLNSMPVLLGERCAARLPFRLVVATVQGRRVPQCIAPVAL
jgi:hypothetical protein